MSSLIAFLNFHHQAVQSASAMAVAIVWSAALGTVITRRVTPTVPELRWWKGAAVSAPVVLLLSVLLRNPVGGVIAAIVIPLAVYGSFVDARTMRIPNLYNTAAVILVLAVTFVVAVTVSGAAAVIAVTAGVAVFLAFLLLALASRNGFGMGDVKFATVIGLALTLVDTTLIPGILLPTPVGLTLLTLHLLVWISTSFVIGGVYGLVRMFRGNRAPFPFGPFLAAGWVLAAAATPAFIGLISPLA